MSIVTEKPTEEQLLRSRVADLLWEADRLKAQLDEYREKAWKYDQLSK